MAPFLTLSITPGLKPFQLMSKPNFSDTQLMQHFLPPAARKVVEPVPDVKHATVREANRAARCDDTTEKKRDSVVSVPDIRVQNETILPLPESSGPSIDFIEDIDEDGAHSPKLTESAAAGTIRLTSRLGDLQKMVTLWEDFQGLEAKGGDPDYLNRCYIGEILNCWRTLHREYKDVQLLRSNGAGSPRLSRVEKDVRMLMDDVTKWRNEHMPRIARPSFRRSLPQSWTVGMPPSAPPSYRPRSTQSTYSQCGAGTRYDQLSMPAHPSAGPPAGPPTPPPHVELKEQIGDGYDTAVTPTQRSVLPAQHFPPAPMRVDGAEVERKRGRAVALVNTIVRSLKRLELSKAQLPAEFNRLRLDLIEAQGTWMEQREKQRSGGS